MALRPCCRLPANMYTRHAARACSPGGRSNPRICTAAPQRTHRVLAGVCGTRRVHALAPEAVGQGETEPRQRHRPLSLIAGQWRPLQCLVFWRPWEESIAVRSSCCQSPTPTRTMTMKMTSCLIDSREVLLVCLCSSWVDACSFVGDIFEVGATNHGP
jgi:hypothetical protein